MTVAIGQWNSRERLQKLRDLTHHVFADIADIDRLYVKINATVKGHVDDAQLKEMMADHTSDFCTEKMDLSKMLLQASQGISNAPWALNDECKALFGLAPSEFASRLRQLSEMLSQAITDYRSRHIKASRPKSTAIDRLMMDLARVYFDVRGTPPTFRRSNGQTELHQDFITLLQATYDVLPAGLNVRSSGKERFVGRAKRCASKIETGVRSHRPVFYDSAVK